MPQVQPQQNSPIKQAAAIKKSAICYVSEIHHETLACIVLAYFLLQGF